MAIDRPRLIVIAGPNGSGKSSLTLALREHTWMRGCVYINPDLIARRKFGGWDSATASLEAAKEAEIKREECVERRENLAFETVFSAPDKVQFVRKALLAGYFVRFFFICTDSPEINIGRIVKRMRMGEHSVPPGKIISRFPKSIAQAAQVVTAVDRAYIFDNSTDQADPHLLFRAVEGRLKKQYLDPVNAWARPILHALPTSKVGN